MIRIKVVSVFLLVFILLTATACAYKSGQTNPTDTNPSGASVGTNTETNTNTDTARAPSLQENLQNAVAFFQQAGFSSGDVKLDGEMTDVYGQRVYECSDAKYKYSIDDMSFQVRGTLINGEEHEKLMLSEQDVLGEEEFVKKGHDLIAFLFPFMDADNLEIKASSPSFIIMERKDDCIVNSGTLELSRGGTIISFTSTHNSVDDFKDTDTFTKEEVCGIVFNELQKTDVNCLTPDNVSYQSMYKEKLGEDVFWIVVVKVIPDGFDPENVLGVYLLKIDVHTGQVEIETGTG